MASRCGTAWGYQRGCRCAECREAARLQKYRARHRNEWVRETPLPKPIRIPRSWLIHPENAGISR